MAAKASLRWICAVFKYHGFNSHLGQTFSRVDGSATYPGYPGRANTSYISLQSAVHRLHEKQKVGSARSVVNPAGSHWLATRPTWDNNNTFSKQNNNVARASHFLAHFFAVFAWLWRENNGARRLGTLETKIAVRNGKCSILTILRKIRGLHKAE